MNLRKAAVTGAVAMTLFLSVAGFGLAASERKPDNHIKKVRDLASDCLYAAVEAGAHPTTGATQLGDWCVEAAKTVWYADYSAE